MKTPIHINHINEIQNYAAYPFIVEIAAFADCGITERWGADSEAEAQDILAEESAACEKWASIEVDNYDPSTDEIPAVAQILIRPEADEDGDIPTLENWQTI